MVDANNLRKTFCCYDHNSSNNIHHNASSRVTLSPMLPLPLFSTQGLIRIIVVNFGKRKMYKGRNIY